MGISEKLMRIQAEIKVPKNLYNNFGKYYYRNAEGICEEVKEYLIREKAILTLTDEIVEIGGRIYVKATACLRDTETQESCEVSAYARESAEKKGMDDSQITGTASSYARKYALNGLFLLDDAKDADTDEYHDQTKAGEKSCGSRETVQKVGEKSCGSRETVQKVGEKSYGPRETGQKPGDNISEEEFQIITRLIREKNVNEQVLLKQYHIDSFIMLTRAQYTALKQKLERVTKK